MIESSDFDRQKVQTGADVSSYMNAQGGDRRCLFWSGGVLEEEREEK